MARQITVDLVSDTKAFERSMGTSTEAVGKLDKSLQHADDSTSKFDHGIEKTTEGLEHSTQKFRGVNDLAGGLGQTLGISGLAQVSAYATGLADMTDGLAVLGGDVLKKAKSAFAAMNATIAANPIVAVIAVIALLAAAFVIAYKKSDTFRSIVNNTMNGIKTAVKDMWDFVKPLFDLWILQFKVIGDAVGKAVSLIKSAWNDTIGGKGIHIPSINLGFTTIGGGGFTIPYLAAGGPISGPAIVGEKGPELFVPRGQGTIVPNHALGGSQVTVVISTGASDLDELIRKRVRVIGNGNVQRAFGAA